MKGRLIVKAHLGMSSPYLYLDYIGIGHFGIYHFFVI